MTDAVAQNKPSWPPESEETRLREYKRGEELFEGEHEKVFCEGGLHAYSYDRPYLAVNLCGALTKTLAWRAFGEGLQISVPSNPAAQQFLDELYHGDALSLILLEAAKTASYRGDA